MESLYLYLFVYVNSERFKGSQLLGISNNEKVKHSNISMLLTVSANIRYDILFGK